MAKNCVICKRVIETEDPAILTMGAYGSPKYICSECEGNIDTITESNDTESVRNACRELGDALTRGDTGDGTVIEAVNTLIAEASERCAKMDEGTYEEPEETPEEEFELTEDLLESEEDRLLDEEEAKQEKLMNTITSWVSGIIIVAAMAFFIYRMLF